MIRNFKSAYPLGMLWTAWLLTLGLALPVSLANCCQVSISETVVVDRYLQRLSLVEMRLEYLLQQIAGTSQADERNLFVKRYGECLALVAPDINQKNSQDWRRYLDAAEDFALRFPETYSSELRHHILRLRFTWTEQQFFDRWQWQSNAESVARWPLELLRLATDVRDARAAINRSQDPLANAGGALSQPSNSNANAQGQISQLIYWEAWIHYFRAVTVTAEREPQALSAIGAFRELLDLPSGQKLGELPSHWVDLRSEPWQWRAVLGLALAYRHLGRDEDADWCFAKLSAVDGVGHSPLSATYWNLCSYLWSGRIAQGIQFLNLNLDQQRPPSERYTWWLACLHEVQLKSQIDQDQIERLLNVGLMGLIRDGHESRIGSEWESLSSLAPVMASGLVWRWAEAIVIWQAAEKSGARESWELAESRFRAIDAQSREQLSRDDQAIFCIHWARTLYQTQQWQAAAEQASKAYAQLRSTQPDRAAALGWLIAQSRLALAAQQSLAVTEARQALLRLQQDFPDSSYAQKAELELLRLDRMSIATVDWFAQLENWQPDHSAYPEAMLLRVAETHRQAIALLETPLENRDSAWQQRFVELEQRLGFLHREFGAQLKRLSVLQALKLEVYFIDVAQRWSDSLQSGTIPVPTSWWNQPGQWELAAERLARLRSQLPAQSLAVSESHYYEWLLALRISDTAGIREHSQWLLENAQQTEFYGAALSHRANQNYDRWQVQPENEQLQQEAIESHQALRTWLQSHRSPQNSQRISVIERRMADWFERLEQWDQANAIYDALREQAGDEAQLLLRAARVKMKLQQWSDALLIWRRLVGGSTAGSSEWFESKLGVIRCLQSIDSAQAWTVWQQTKDLYPQMPEPWQSQFRELKWD